MPKLPVFLSLFVFMTYTSLSQAIAGEWASADYVQARLISAQTSDDQMKAAIEIKLSEGWHAYWRMPGDAGLPPQFKWDESQNLADVKIMWPAPKRYEVMGFYSFGYDEHVVLPIRVTPAVSDDPVILNAVADIMVCKDICVPQTVSLSHTLIGNEHDSAALSWIEAAEEQVPLSKNVPSLKIENVVVGPNAIVVTAFSQSGYEGADVFVEAGDIFITAPPEVILDDKDKRRAMLKIKAPDGIENLAALLAKTDVRLTLVSSEGAVEKEIPFSQDNN